MPPLVTLTLQVDVFLPGTLWVSDYTLPQPERPEGFCRYVFVLIFFLSLFLKSCCRGKREWGMTESEKSVCFLCTSECVCVCVCVSACITVGVRREKE